MYNCIFNGHCTEEYLCTQACPILAQTTYLLEDLNGFKMSNPVFRMTEAEISKYSKILTQSKGDIRSVIVSTNSFTNQAADALTYCAICDNWKGSQLHSVVYNLKFAQYVEAVQKSWSSNDSESENMKIWASGAKVLIISHLDFVNFKDFQSQLLLSLIQSRVNTDLTTIIVTPPTSSLVGDGQFFARLTDMLTKQKVGDNL